MSGSSRISQLLAQEVNAQKRSLSQFPCWVENVQMRSMDIVYDNMIYIYIIYICIIHVLDLQSDILYQRRPAPSFISGFSSISSNPSIFLLAYGPKLTNNEFWCPGQPVLFHIYLIPKMVYCKCRCHNKSRINALPNDIVLP